MQADSAHTALNTWTQAPPCKSPLGRLNSKDGKLDLSRGTLPFAPRAHARPVLPLYNSASVDPSPVFTMPGRLNIKNGLRRPTSLHFAPRASAPSALSMFRPRPVQLFGRGAGTRLYHVWPLEPQGRQGGPARARRLRGAWGGSRPRFYDWSQRRGAAGTRVARTRYSGPGVQGYGV